MLQRVQVELSRVVSDRGTRRAARVGAHFGSPLALAASVVTLVAGLGLASSVGIYRALCHVGEQRAAEALAARSTELHASLADALGHADALLERLTPHLRGVRSDGDLTVLLPRMHDLAVARHGLTWISASFPDGAFVGVRVDDDGTLAGLSSRADGESAYEHHYRFAADGKPVEVERMPTTYDPRARTFYRHAVARGRRSWTEAYPFVPTWRTGVSRVQPLYAVHDRPDTLHCVLTVDYDASGLAVLLKEPMTPSQRRLVLTADGAVLAASGVKAQPEQPRERALSWSELDDPALRAARGALSLTAPGAARTVQVHGEPWRLEHTRVAMLDDAPIVLVSILPESELFARAHAEARRCLLITAVVALLGLGLALVLSSNIAQLRRRRAEAELAMERAREEVAELGSYRLLAPIGTGGMGEVFRARHKLLARDAALKLIKRDASDDADARRGQFFEEARILASLRSVHTVAIYDFGIAHDGRYFLAMELLDGLDLEALVREYGPQPAARVAKILAEVCDSLSEAHAAGLVHRDIKPANVFLCRLAEWLDVAKVLDFGLTRAIGSGVHKRTVEGTPGYMAPEQARGGEVGPLSDLYSVGCLGFWLLAGRPPYEAASFEAVLEAHVGAQVPQLPEDVRAKTPPALVQILMRCMAKRAEHRPVSAAVLARALRRVADACADTFTDEMRLAFWSGRTLLQTGTVRGDPTLPMISIGVRNERMPAA